MGSFSRLLHDDQFQMPMSSHIASPVYGGPSTTMFGQSGPSTSNTFISSPMQAESEEEEDGLDNMDVDPPDREGGEAMVRPPIPWFSQLNENYEVDQYWAESGSHTTFVIGGEFEKGMFFESKKLLQEMVKKKICLKVEFIQELISKNFQFDVTYRRAWYDREKAISEVFGDWESSYGRLPHFMEALKQSNPRTVVVWKHKALVDGVYYSNMEVFERVFWAFGPCVEGFKHCMSVICIDGTHLYWKFKGTLLVATSVDANFQVFPPAFALVEGENTSSWSWFMGCIRVHVTQRDGLCVISDRHAGIIAAMNDLNVGFIESRAYHRFCVRHLASNLKTHVRRNDMRDMFKAAAYQRQERKLQAD
ncbi:uncharacterized protein LOC110739096 [Chenopodium quinoa]|uniref:uncharacterized protein LOC110739096 n=1 Tax=Chenopodium quinoa TaxID=63459 RepID=UPI000B794910|nr:uncharacterized protein LOC110739096 [Chenopodium quinoa]